MNQKKTPYIWKFELQSQIRQNKIGEIFHIEEGGGQPIRLVGYLDVEIKIDNSTYFIIMLILPLPNNFYICRLLVPALFVLGCGL